MHRISRAPYVPCDNLCCSLVGWRATCGGGDGMMGKEDEMELNECLGEGGEQAGKQVAAVQCAAQLGVAYALLAITGV